MVVDRQATAGEGAREVIQIEGAHRYVPGRRHQIPDRPDRQAGRDHALVVWYDPEKHYRAVAADLTLPNTTVARYDGSFLQLRREIDPLLNDQHPPRLVVYVPMDQGDTDHALDRTRSAGVVIQPGQQPPTRNTRLSVVARNALRPLRGEDNAAEIEKQVEAGKLTLADLDTLGEKKDSGVLSLIFGTGNPQEVASASWRATASTTRSRRNPPVANSPTFCNRPSRSTSPTASLCPRCGSGWLATSC